MNAQAKINHDCVSLESGAKPGVLIVGGAIGTLAAARSLGRQSIRVWHLTEDYALSRWSRYVEHTLAWQGAQTDAAADELIALAKQNDLQGWVLIPGGDMEVRLIARNHTKLAQAFRLTTQAWDVVQWADDKNLTYQLAERCGIAVPRRYRPKNLDEVRALDCRFPVILKPARHQGENAFTLAKAWIAADRTALNARYAQAAAAVEPGDIVLQEMIPGDGRTQFSYAAIWRDGKPLAALVATRSRQYPINVGYTSTFVQVVDNAAVTEAAARWLSAINYSGPVEVEFKFDARDGTYKILDVNPRLWAWIGIGDAAGLDFATLLYRSALGEPVTPAVARADAAWMHGSRDLIAAVQEMLAGRLSAKRYLAGFHKTLAFAVFASDDPLPMLAEPPITLYRVLTRRLLARVSRWLTRPAQIARPD